MYNGPSKGANVVNNQDSYDLIFKDIIVKSENRDYTKYPNPNSFSINLGEHISKIYKAEIIAVNVPAATDPAVNIESGANALYFCYNDSSNNDSSSNHYGYLIIQSGTYVSPQGLASDIQRRFVDMNLPVLIIFNINLNRYLFRTELGKTFTIYPTNGQQCGPYTVTNSIGYSLRMPNTSNINTTQRISLADNGDGNVVVTSNDGGYGMYDGFMLDDYIFNNTIASDTVLTNCSIYLSLGALNSNTIQFAPSENGGNNVSNIFCEIPNNTSVSSVSNKTLLNQPSIWSGVNFYNPPVANLTRLEVKWYDENGQLINILENCFTIRIYYFQKRNSTTLFSTPVVNYYS